MAKDSKYLERYLNSNRSEPLYTIGTYLHYTLRGTAKAYSSKYERALQNSIDRLLATGKVKEVKSARSQRAYVWNDCTQHDYHEGYCSFCGHKIPGTI